MSIDLIVEPNIPDADGFYEALIAMHAGLRAEQSHLLNAKLILLLANHIGDMGVLLQAMEAARTGLLASTSVEP